MPEYLDVYDIHRRRTGKILARGNAFQKGEFTLVVHLLLFNEKGEFLVQKRVPYKSSWPDMWDISLGGHAQAGEDSAAAVTRESHEELGLSLDFANTSPVISVRTENIFDDYWMAQIPSHTSIVLQAEEVSECKWVDRTQWLDMLARREVIPYSFQYSLFDLYEAHFPGTRLFPFGDPRKICGAVFDMDGLLLDTERVVSRSWDAAAEKFCLSDIEPVKKACLGLNEAGTRAVFERAYGADFPFEEFRDMTRRLSHAVLDVQVPVKPGAHEILQMLRKYGISLAVASSTREVTVRDQLGRAGLLPFLDAVITGDMVTYSKPHPEIFRMACDAIGVPPENCLAFEDSVNGIRSAYRAGTYPVHIPDLVLPGTETRALSWKCFPSLTEAARYLEKRYSAVFTRNHE